MRRQRQAAACYGAPCLLLREHIWCIVRERECSRSRTLRRPIANTGIIDRQPSRNPGHERRIGETSAKAKASNCSRRVGVCSSSGGFGFGLQDCGNPAKHATRWSRSNLLIGISEHRCCTGLPMAGEEWLASEALPAGHLVRHPGHWQLELTDPYGDQVAPLKIYSQSSERRRWR